MDDADLARMVRDALSYVGGLDESYLRITCHDGVVALAGVAFTHSQRREAENVASRVAGVRRVVNEIAVVTPSGG